MPTNLSIADSSFPQLTKQQSTDEKFDKIQSYLYMLLESLRFSLSNLDKDNFNDAGLDEISDMITEPVYAQISDVKGNVTSLALTAQGLSTRISDAEGNINTLSVRADSLTSRITSVEGDVSTLNQTATSLTARISDAEGDVSVLQQTATSLSSRISNAEADISLIQQTANSLTLAVTNGDTSSVIRLKAGETLLSSQTIKFTGIVTFSDLSTAGSTTINGGNITTGTISAIRQVKPPQQVRLRKDPARKLNNFQLSRILLSGSILFAEKIFQAAFLKAFVFYAQRRVKRKPVIP